jgi:hypothetical protein
MNRNRVLTVLLQDWSELNLLIGRTKMMKKAGLLVLVSLFLSSTTVAGQEEKVLSDSERSCRTWAKEDGIQQDEMMEYMLSCLRQIRQLDTQHDEKFMQTSLDAGQNMPQVVETGEKQ